MAPLEPESTALKPEEAGSVADKLQLSTLTSTRTEALDTVDAVACGTVVAVGFRVEAVVRFTVVGVPAMVVALADVVVVAPSTVVVGDVPVIARSLAADRPSFTAGASNASGSGLSTWVFES